MQVSQSRLEKNFTYRVTCGNRYVIGTYRGRVEMGGEAYLVFEGAYMHHLVSPQVVMEVERVTAVEKY